MEWFDLANTLLGAAVGGLIVYLVGAAGRAEQHQFDLQTREKEGEIAADAREADRQQELRRERLRPVFELLDACESHLSRRALKSMVQNSFDRDDVKARMVEQGMATLSASQRDELEREVLKAMSDAEGSVPDDWGPATLIRQMHTVFRITDEELRDEVGAMLALATSQEYLTDVTLDVQKMATTLGTLRERVELYAARHRDVVDAQRNQQALS